MSQVLVCERFDALALAGLRAQVEVQTAFDADPTPEQLKASVGLLIRSKTKITSELLSQTPILRVIVSATSGFDHIDLKACTARGICVMNTPDAQADSAAELTLGLILSCTRRLNLAFKAVADGRWEKNKLLGTQLHGKTLSIVGLGRIGTKVAQMGRAFGMQTLAYDPYLSDQEFSSRHASRCGFEEAFRCADILTFHVPSTADTHRTVNVKTLDFLSEGTVLINTSRGRLIDEAHLKDALDAGRVSWCGLDVFEREPLSPQSPLFGHPRVIATPHIGANTEEAFRRSCMDAASKILNYMASGKTEDILPPQAPWYSLESSRSFR